MDRNKIVLIAIAILVIALLALGAYIITSNGGNGSVNDNVTVNKSSNNSSIVMIDEKGNVTNDTVVGDNSTRNTTNTTNQTYRVYNPQTDSYVTVVGEAYDDEVDRWYTYDTDGVRYYNTRIIA
jgi:hypothetical protein